MTMYLLDTNIVSAIAANPKGHVASRLADCDDEVGVSVMVAAELRFGLSNNPGSGNAARSLRAIGTMIVHAFDDEAAAYYGQIRAVLKRTGNLIGQIDMLIAAHAMALDATLVSDDRAFMHVPELKLENWLADRA